MLIEGCNRCVDLTCSHYSLDAMLVFVVHDESIATAGCLKVSRSQRKGNLEAKATCQHDDATEMLLRLPPRSK